MTLNDYMRNRTEPYEIILIENGSHDNTLQIAQNLTNSIDQVRCFSLDKPSLSDAMKLGFREAVYDKLIYFPVDLSINLSFIPESLELLQDYDIVVGSKRQENTDNRPLKRRILSRGYHWMVRRLFGINLTDTTCVKAYRKDVALNLVSLVPSFNQVFETELLVEAQKKRYKIKEIPVTVTDYRESRQPLGTKVGSKLRDLLSIRLDVMAFWVGTPILLFGLFLLADLSLKKLVTGRSGFTNPYTFLISMLLVLSGFQIIVYGFFANLLLQLRKSVEYRVSNDSIDEKRTRRRVVSD